MKLEPVISGNCVVISDNRRGNSDIYMYDLDSKTETQITSDKASQIEPAISGDKIVWTDRRNQNTDIYMYDLTTKKETQITTDKAEQTQPAISEKHYRLERYPEWQ